MSEEKSFWTANDQAESFNKHFMNENVATKHILGNSEKDATRLPFQRQRDRIVWSRSFKRLAYKSQIFPHGYSDHQRQRLTHSLEVMQLSSSIARTLGLNSLLCEAIALAHDLGHTPFGHAGEWSLDNALKYTVSGMMPFKIRGLQRFTHYEQGIDVVKYMDTVTISEKSPFKTSATKAAGLNLSNEVIDGILKHTHNHDGDENEYKSLKFLIRHTKYRDVLKTENAGSLEAQLVRVCDKISYFISDLEDGLIVDAFHLNDIMRIINSVLTKNKESSSESEIQQIKVLFDEVKEKYDYYSKSTRLYRQFKDELLTILINSLISSSRRKIDNKDYTKHEDGGFNLIIDFEGVVKKLVKSLRKELLEQNLFRRNIIVKKENSRAEHIVSCLFCQYVRHPELVPWDFRSRYIISDDNKIYNAISKIYLDQNQEETACGGKTTREDGLLKPVNLNLSSWFTNNRRPMGVQCPNGDKFCKVKLFPADLICIKDFIAGMTNNYAEVRYQGDVDCHASREFWKEKNMDRRKFFNISLVS